MGYTCFDVTESDHVAHVQLNRPDKLNSMIPEFWTRAARDRQRASAPEGRARAIVISSTGKHFSAGMDLSVFTGGGGDLGGSGSSSGGEARAAEAGRARARLRETALLLQDSFTALEQARMPVLAAIQGGCIGGAVDMVTACDLRYATADAFFVHPGDQHRHDRRRRHPAAPAQADPRRHRAASWPTSAAACRPSGPTRSAWSTGSSTTHDDAGRRRARGGRRDRGQEPAGHLGLEGDDHLRPRPLRRRLRSTTSPPGRPACSSRPT